MSDERRYSARNLMVQIARRTQGDAPPPACNPEEGTDCGALPPDRTHYTNYAYDGRGVRTTMKFQIGTTTDGCTKVQYFYTPELNFLSRRMSSGAYEDFIWFAGQPVAEASAASIRYTFTDHLGTPELQMDPAGAVVWKREAEPYGNTYEMRTGEAGDQILRFPGQELSFYGTSGEEESYNIFRWYRSGWGRYTQSDPLGLAGGANLYLYVNANPLAEVDPQGLIAMASGESCPAFELAMQQLRRMRGSSNCSNCRRFFADQFLANFDQLVDGPSPVVRVRQPGDPTALAETPCERDPGAIWIRPSMCSRFSGAGLRGGLLAIVLVHELAHIADCAGQRYPLGGGTEEGAHAEIACFGRRHPLANQPPGPLGPPMYGPMPR